MSEFNYDGAKNEQEDKYMSTSYSNKIICGICSSPLKHVPAMYEKMDIDWRCGKCLRRDKPTQEEAAS